MLTRMARGLAEVPPATGIGVIILGHAYPIFTIDHTIPLNLED